MAKKTQNQTIAKLKKELAMLKSIIAKTPGTVYWKDVHGKYLGCNENTAKILKLNHPKDIIGKTDIELLGKKLSKSIIKTDQDIIKNKKTKIIEELGFDIHNQPAYYASHKSPLFDQNGKIMGIVGMAVDITKRKEMETKLKIAKQKAQAANRAKSRFLATISHELRTPLTSMLGMTHMLEEKKIKQQKRKQYIDNIIISGNYLSSLINNLLDFNKLEKKKYTLTVNQIDLYTLFYHVKKMFESAAVQKGLHFQLEYDSRLPKLVLSDSGVIMQILVNLIGNAIKFTSQGEVKIIVQLMGLKQATASIYIAVEDTGFGIPAKELTSIFKPFYQVGNPFTREASLSGTGLGLSIVKKLVTLLKSKIQVQSIPGKGSTFSFTANVKIPEQKSTLNRPHQKKKSHGTHTNTLLIEDDKLIQVIHTGMLKQLNCHVTICENATSAIKHLQKPFDIIFVDIGLPDINGFELIKIIRKKQQNRCVIIALTGYSDKKNQKACVNAGADEVLIKPISIMILEETIRKYSF